MPKGIKKTEISIDNINPTSSLEDNSFTSSPKEPDISPTAKAESIDSSEYTIDPITKKKYFKPKGDDIYLGQKAFRIPTIRREGYIIIWPVDRGNEIQNLLYKNWEFVDPATPGCEKAASAPYGGSDKEGKPIFHRAMQMEVGKYNEMMRRESEANTAKENEIIFDPSRSSGKDFYAAKEHRAPTVTNNSNMDPMMAAAYTKAMR